MRSSCLCGVALAGLVLLAPRGGSAADVDHPEMAKIYEADQKDRSGGPEAIDWTLVGPRDAARRQRVRTLLEQGALRTGKDYERAAFVFQHGDTSDEILLAHVLAVTALGRGNLQARWIAAASLDRYLQRLKQPQVFGTQFTRPDAAQGGEWSLEPYNRQLLPASLLEANCIPDREHQKEMLAAIQRGVEPPAPKRAPCAVKPELRRR